MAETHGAPTNKWWHVEVAISQLILTAGMAMLPLLLTVKRVKYS